MKSTRTVFTLALVCAATVFGIRVNTSTALAGFATHVEHASVPEPSPTNAPAAKADVKTAGGLTTVTFDTKSGNVRVNLPDDIRAGDTISGTVIVEPKGQSEEERKKAAEAVRTFSVEISPQETQPDGRYTTTAAAHTVRMAHYSATDILFTMTLPPIDPSRGLDVLGVTLKGEDSTPGTVTFPLKIGRLIPLERLVPTQPKAPSNPPSSSPPSGAANFQLPALGQQGRPAQIFGPFDGNASNTTLRFVPTTSAVKDFEKSTENVSGGFGLVKPLAESPRQLVFEIPTNVTGPAEIVLKEGDVEARGVAHVVGVALSAPKTNLMRGEKTVVTVEVRGLEGIKKDVPLQLDSKGVITMEGGNFQNLRIKPQEVKQDGTYTTNRGITGQQAGGFTVTATVIVRPFDFCLQDDTDPNRIFHFNSFTGDYIFACGGGSCRPSGAPSGTQTGGTTGPGGTGPPPIQPSGTTLTGIGRPAMKGCIITLSHNAPDRRVFARLDACTKTGEASVQTHSPKTDINITDKNTTDNTAASPPPK